MTLVDFLSINGQTFSAAGLVAEDFYEWQPLEIECAPQPDVVAAGLAIGELDLGPPTIVLGDKRWRWRWNPQQAVGHYLATLRLDYADGRTHTESFGLRILPRKVDAACYEALLVSIQHEARALVYGLAGGRSAAALHASGPAPTLVEEYNVLVERHVAQAVAVVKQLDRVARSRLVSRKSEVQLWELERIEPTMLAHMAQAPFDDLAEDVLPDLQAALRGPGRRQGGPLPRLSPARRTQATHDLVEHQVLKHVLRVLLRRVGYVRAITRREQLRRQQNATLVEGRSRATLNHWLKRCAEAAAQLHWALGLAWLVDVGPLGSLTGPTQLMRRDPRYRRLYQLYRELRTTPFLAFDSQLLWMPIHELPLLYEQWCTLRVVKALLPLGKVIEQSLVELADAVDGSEEPRWTLRLQQTRPLLVLQLTDDFQLTVWYQRRYQPMQHAGTTLGTLDPFVRIPDIAIEVTRTGRPVQVLVADAKYRVAPNGGVPQDALDDAYAYRSAIGAAGSRATLGALLLFPGSEPLMTQDRVGAVPLLPGVGDELGQLLQSFLLSAGEP